MTVIEIVAVVAFVSVPCAVYGYYMGYNMARVDCIIEQQRRETDGIRDGENRDHE
jgi:hypothetical protein